MDETVTSFSEAQNEIADAMLRMKAQLHDAANVQQIQLLALRRYLRMGGRAVASAWPWSTEQRDVNKKDSDRMNAEAAKVVANFATQNPGLKLDRTGIRNLAKQIELWCGNESVHLAAGNLLPRVLQELAKADYPEFPTDSAPINQFKKFLKDSKVDPEPTSAAPGTSDHGQDRAVDFIVKKDGKTVASTSKAGIKKEWENTGYDKALKKATEGTEMDGPLPNPKEPWHYWLKKAKKAK